MKKDPIITSLIVFSTLFILQIVLIFILVTFSDKKPNMEIWGFFTTNIPFVVAIWFALKIFKIKLAFEFIFPGVKLFLFIFLLASCLIVIDPLITILSFISNASRNIIEYKFISISLNLTSIIYIFNVVLVGPILEELFYRKIILTQINKKYNALLSILISSILFSLLHLNYIQCQKSFLFGLLVGYIYLKTRRIEIPIILHSLFNLFIIISSNKTLNLDKNYYLLIIYIAVTLFGYFLVKKIIRNGVRE